MKKIKNVKKTCCSVICLVGTTIFYNKYDSKKKEPNIKKNDIFVETILITSRPIELIEKLPINKSLLLYVMQMPGINKFPLLYHEGVIFKVKKFNDQHPKIFSVHKSWANIISSPIYDDQYNAMFFLFGNRANMTNNVETCQEFKKMVTETGLNPDNFLVKSTNQKNKIFYDFIKKNNLIFPKINPLREIELEFVGGKLPNMDEMNSLLKKIQSNKKFRFLYNCQDICNEIRDDIFIFSIENDFQVIQTFHCK